MKNIVFGFLGRQWKEWRGTVLFVVFVLMPLKSSVADWNWVPTGSMNLTILEGDLVYVDKLAYDLRVPLTFKRVAEWADERRIEEWYSCIRYILEGLLEDGERFGIELPVSGSEVLELLGSKKEVFAEVTQPR